MNNSFTFNNLEDSAVNKISKTEYGENTGWNIYKDIMFPGTSISGKLKHLRKFKKHNRVLNCRITEGDKYNNVFYTSTLARQWNNKKWYFAKANTFNYSMDFYVDNYIDCSNGNLSELEGLEFTFQKAEPPLNFLWGLQWSKSNVWSFWDDAKSNGRVKGWVHIPSINACIQFNKWNKIKITGQIINNELYYDKLHLNGLTFSLNKKINCSSLPAHWVENYLQIGFQINGDKAIRKDHVYGTDPVSVYLDNVCLQVAPNEY